MARKTNLDPKLREILANIDDNDQDLLAEPKEDRGDRLRTLYQRLTNGRENALRPGMLAVWKPGLKNRRFPAYGEPIIVVDLLAAPIMNHEDEAGSPYYQEPLNLVLAYLHRDGEFLIYHADRRRFQPYEDGAPDRC